MQEPSTPTSPGERRLDRPPSERYRETAPSEAVEVARTPSAGRAGGLAVLAGLGGAAVTVGLGGVLGMSAGLLVVAGTTGWAIGAVLRVVAGDALSRDRRSWVAVAIAAFAVALGQAGLWLYAQGEGGVLSLPEYLGQTFGWLVPAQVVLALGLAWWAAR